MLRPCLMYLLILGFCCSYSCAQHNTTELAQHQHSEHTQDIVAKLKENSHLSVIDQANLYRQFKADHPDAYNFDNEDQLTMYG